MIIVTPDQPPTSSMRTSLPDEEQMLEDEPTPNGLFSWVVKIPDPEAPLRLSPQREPPPKKQKAAPSSKPVNEDGTSAGTAGQTAGAHTTRKAPKRPAKKGGNLRKKQAAAAAAALIAVKKEEEHEMVTPFDSEMEELATASSSPIP
ncbi:hypothetical protein CYLTODRAFT_171202 [Cylindrobasidium torrendii FP15055 ss-10]|uniref:Uncharacterized protein n=1 Tax=Cylindrobasidium torrendii FP15055 ss-10 TaxID=1314674 RepID=A0A0D7BJN9_9AGAR|nr:hypothetical protein CYLTODRAFT_171202 [Cylindrobasidium torrendii FP15055 ss-10]